MTSTVQAGDTFIIDPTGGSNDHLWIVLHVWVPDYDHSEFAVIVNVTSITKFADHTCVLKPTDPDAHPFVVHDSYAFYRMAREMPMTDLLKLGEAKRRQPACAALLRRLRDGLHRSPQTPRGFKGVVPKS